jgi:cellulose synthase/poly-beta-1,6-N-acetylglucosamine synthase-like glycosyltransferase
MGVTGLVFSIGEKTTSRAMAGLRNQTVACKDIVVVNDVSPFYKAMNTGIAKIKTPFFVQCDADMILDPDCIETMLKFIRKDVGVVIAFLKDPLLGKIQAVKMFRTACFKAAGFSNHVSPDTDFISRLKKRGWRYVFAGRRQRRFHHAADVLGEHRPEYTPQYTFEKFRLMGARMRNRGVFQELMDSLQRLNKSPHPMAPVAMIGLCRGIFSGIEKDGLKKYKVSRDFKILEAYMNSRRTTDDFVVTAQAGKRG